MTRQATLDPQLLLISPEDNCLIVRHALPAGARVQLEDGSAVIAAPLGLGHKLARRAMPAGEKILKYGAIIGSLTAAVAAGDHIHTHNLDSDYTPTYTLEEGRAFTDRH
ncbi:UxaA family hydrolase [Achromobacter deleyi]|uniref:UxaA family hydrolase n=1 Tax=Achromobacter deleyi TaxID=1353891 RepID=A0A7T4E1X7_9BURK|nr:UxaA family hydrolase [Achromobacter deleyi]QQB32449.1 UxaA family hydrolase [Achromobacter deleyi]